MWVRCLCREWRRASLYGSLDVPKQELWVAELVEKLKNEAGVI